MNRHSDLNRTLPAAGVLVVLTTPPEVAQGAQVRDAQKAIIAYVQRTFPGKSITHVVSHHHHADHSGGLRPFGAFGAGGDP